jgi:AcrR family transcriptional regulator
MENEKVEIRDKIIITSVDVFQRLGARNVTMDDLARALGMSKKTLYQHFSDKKDLIRACMQSHIDRQECGIGDIMCAHSDAEQQVFNVMDYVEKELKSMAGAHRLIHDIQLYFPDTWQLFRKHKEEYVIKILEDNLRKGIEEGVYRPEIDVRVIARIRSAEIDAMINPDIFPMFEYNLHHLFEQLLLYYLYGICNAKGEKQLAKLLRLKHQQENP